MYNLHEKQIYTLIFSAPSNKDLPTSHDIPFRLLFSCFVRLFQKFSNS
jgi:hypothetical protein